MPMNIPGPSKNFDPRRPELRGTDRLGDLYGITYDKDTIRSKFDRATKTEFDRRRKEHGIAEDRFYDQMHDTQRTALDTLRRGQTEAVATGASRGMQAAQELSTVLGLGQETAEGATDLAQQRALLGDREAEAYTQNVVEALAESNRLRQAMGELDAQAYAADTQFGVGEMDYYARLEQAVRQLQGMGLQADAQRYTADKNLVGTKYSADQQLKGQEAQAAATKASARISAAAQTQAANISASAQRDAAKLSAQAQQNPAVDEALEDALNKPKEQAIPLLQHYLPETDIADLEKMWEASHAPNITTSPGAARDPSDAKTPSIGMDYLRDYFGRLF